MQHAFEGIWIPLVTPWRNDALDTAALSALARHLAPTGIAGFVVGATTGEGMLLRPGEMESVVACLREVTALPLMLGLAESDTARAADRARQLAALRPAALLASPPAYLRPSQRGVQMHFEAIVQAADAPVMLYDIPYRTAVPIAFETFAALARDPRVVGVKACGGDLDKLSRLLQETPLQVLSGDDALNFVAMCLGAHGTIAATAHVRPDWHVAMRHRLIDGDLAGARAIAWRLETITRLLFSEPSPAPLKAGLASRGLIAASLRAPFVPASDELQQRIAREWSALDEAALP